MKFWTFWIYKTPLEKRYISAWEKIEKEILNNPINKSQIISIYIGGSFQRRELKEGSDIDAYVIFDDINLVKANLQKENDGIRFEDINISLTFYSLDELFKKRFEINRTKKFIVEPKIFLKNLSNYKLTYGKRLKKGDIDTTYTDEEALKNNIQNLLGYMGQTHGDHHMKAVAKQFFMIVYYEKKILGEIKESFSRKTVINSVREIENHLIKRCEDILQNHDKYINSPDREKYLSQKQELFQKIEEYVKELEKKI